MQALRQGSQPARLFLVTGAGMLLDEARLEARDYPLADPSPAWVPGTFLVSQRTISAFLRQGSRGRVA